MVRKHESHGQVMFLAIILGFSHNQSWLFFCCERLSASMARSLRLELYLYTAVDSRPDEISLDMLRLPSLSARGFLKGITVLVAVWAPIFLRIVLGGGQGRITGPLLYSSCGQRKACFLKISCRLVIAIWDGSLAMSLGVCCASSVQTHSDRSNFTITPVLLFFINHNHDQFLLHVKSWSPCDQQEAALLDSCSLEQWKNPKIGAGARLMCLRICNKAFDGEAEVSGNFKVQEHGNFKVQEHIRVPVFSLQIFLLRAPFGQYGPVAAFES